MQIPDDPALLLGLINGSILKFGLLFRDASKQLGLEALWLMGLNMGQTFGLPYEWVDGIPVQNKWMGVVLDRLQYLGKREAQLETMNFMVHMVTGQMERIVGQPMPMFLQEYGENQ